MTSLRDLFRGSTRQEPPDEPLEQEADILRQAAIPVSSDDPASLDPLIQAMADKRLVLLGEATHGTHEFYDLRRQISLRLIRDHGFAGIVAEADWPDAARVHRYLQGRGEDANARQALGGFVRFPLWMWRNTVVLDLIEELAEHNRRLAPGAARAGFWGMDLYSLYTSVSAVLEYLQKMDPEAARRARLRYGCFDPFEHDPQAYGAAAAGFDHHDDCEDQAVEQLVDLLRQRADFARRDGEIAEEEYFFAEQNARLIASAEHYYRAMYRGGINTWNLRDTHMADTVDALSHHLHQRHGRPARLILWAHNSHLGDARHTEMGQRRGEINVGQLLRQRHGQEVFALGFTTHAGTVAAADNWDEPPRLMRVSPSRPDSLEHLCHRAACDSEHDSAGPARRGAFALMPGADSAAAGVLARPRLQRAIGVIYRPATERASHYFRAAAGRQFDALLHVDTTRALRPLDPSAAFTAPEEAAAPETFPTGL